MNKEKLIELEQTRITHKTDVKKQPIKHYKHLLEQESQLIHPAPKAFNKQEQNIIKQQFMDLFNENIENYTAKE